MEIYSLWHFESLAQGEARERWGAWINRQANKSVCKAERETHFTTPQWTYPWPISLCSFYTLQTSLWSVVWSLEVTFLPGGSVVEMLSGLLFMSCQCHGENYSFGILLHPAGCLGHLDGVDGPFWDCKGCTLTQDTWWQQLLPHVPIPAPAACP